MKHECALVIPGTFIACGEDGNYCSEKCAREAHTLIPDRRRHLRKRFKKREKV